MTKTESANRTVQAVVIEACEQLLECQMSAGARLAIPNTGNLIMVGTPEWIAKNVPGVEAMVAERATVHCQEFHELAMDYRAANPFYANKAYDELVAYIDTRLAATTQASTAQAEMPEWLAYDAEADALTIHGVKYSGDLLRDFGKFLPLKQPFMIESREHDGALAVCRLDWAVIATSSTDAQAAAEVRDAAPAEPEHDPLYEKAVLIVRAHNRASVSLVQRHLLIGYNRASRIIEAMEAAGVVSASDDKGQRTVLRSAGDTGGTQIREEGSFYAVAKARGFTDFGLTISGKYSDDKLQALREQYDVEGAGDTGGAND